MSAAHRSGRATGRPSRGHVLVARLDSRGDVLLAGPAVRAVAAHARRVTLLVGPRGLDAARLLPGVDEIRLFRAPWIDPEPEPVCPEATQAFVDEMAALRVDQAILLTSFHQSPLPLALLLRLARVPEIAAISEDYPGSLLDLRHRVPDDLHEVQRALSLVGNLGYRLPAHDGGTLAIRRPPGGVSWVPPWPSYVVVHPGTSVPARAWRADRFAALVDLLAITGHAVVVTGAPDERELTAQVAGPPRPEVLDLGGHGDFAQLAEVLAGADAVVVANTGPAHLAAAVGTPVVSLFAPTVPAARWRPWRVPHVLLGQQEIACAGCRARVCPVAGHPCLDTISPLDALHAVETLRRDSRRSIQTTAPPRPEMGEILRGKPASGRRPPVGVRLAHDRLPGSSAPLRLRA